MAASVIRRLVCVLFIYVMRLICPNAGFAHATNQEVHYDGYIIPEGTAM